MPSCASGIDHQAPDRRCCSCKICILRVALLPCIPLRCPGTTAKQAFLGFNAGETCFPDPVEATDDGMATTSIDLSGSDYVCYEPTGRTAADRIEVRTTYRALLTFVLRKLATTLGILQTSWANPAVLSRWTAVPDSQAPGQDETNVPLSVIAELRPHSGLLKHHDTSEATLTACSA